MRRPLSMPIVIMIVIVILIVIERNDGGKDCGASGHG